MLADAHAGGRTSWRTHKLADAQAGGRTSWRMHKLADRLKGQFDNLNEKQEERVTKPYCEIHEFVVIMEVFHLLNGYPFMHYIA